VRELEEKDRGRKHKWMSINIRILHYQHTSRTKKFKFKSNAAASKILKK